MSARVISKQSTTIEFCKLNKKALALISFKLANEKVYLTFEYLEKIKAKHEKDWLEYGQSIESILKYPGYIGYRSRNRTLLLVKKFKTIHICVPIHITRKRKRLDIRSFYQIPERTFISWLNNGNLRKV